MGQIQFAVATAIPKLTMSAEMCAEKVVQTVVLNVWNVAYYLWDDGY